jgi:hypothetical protein
MIGHLYIEHGHGIHPSSSLVFKNLKAIWAIRFAGRGRNRRGFGSGSGGFANNYGSFYEERNEDEEKDNMSEENPGLNRKRAADARNHASLTGPMGDAATKGALAGANTMGMVGAIVNSVEPLAPPSPNQVRDHPKRKKTTEEEGSSVNSDLAGSMDRRRSDK